MTRPTRERRIHDRFDLSCPVVITDSSGEELLRTKTLNLSEGGVLLESPTEQTIGLDENVSMSVRLPRSTPNTFMFEEFSSAARVVRHQPMVDYSNTATAFAFVEPLKLGLEV